MKLRVHSRPLLVGILSTALAVSASVLAGSASAVPGSPTGASAAEPGGSPEAKSPTGPDSLGQHDRELLAEAISNGKKRINVIVLTAEGDTASVAGKPSRTSEARSSTASTRSAT